MSKRAMQILSLTVSSAAGLASAWAFMNGNNALGFYALVISLGAPIVPLTID